ncbi:hypothetical protein, partial [Devosia sp.]|uniref:hypothetical protein n=1 Tax=Devosia sp. TaxID=1871048 RepID=UPI0025C630BA
RPSRRKDMDATLCQQSLVSQMLSSHMPIYTSSSQPKIPGATLHTERCAMSTLSFLECWMENTSTL